MKCARLSSLVLTLILPLFCACVTSEAANSRPSAAKATPSPSAVIPPVVSANDMEGAITLVGSAPNARPIMATGADKSQTDFCPGPQQDMLRRLSGTIVKVSGSWSTNKYTKEKCLEVSSFKVTQITKDRPAMIGELKKEDAKYVLVSDEGKRYVLETPTKGIKELAGKKLITDLVPAAQTSDTTSTEASWKVVSYMEYPTP